MKKYVYIFFVFWFFFNPDLFGQSGKTYDSLCRMCNLANSDTQRVVAFQKLAGFLYNNHFISKADSVLRKQILVAELLDDKELLLKTYFDNPAANIVEWSSSADFDRVVNFLQKALDHARRINDRDHIAIGYTRLAAVLRKRGKYSQALENLSNAQINSQASNDSIKAMVSIEAGNYYMTREQFFTAGAHFNNAFEIATRINSRSLESEIYRCLASLNSAIGDETTSKDFLLKSAQLDKQYNNGEGLVRDYIRLAKHEAEAEYVRMAIALADSLHLDGLRIAAKEVMLSIYMNSAATADTMIAYLESEPELKQYFKRGGGENYPYELGYFHLYGGNPDSALFYFESVRDNMLKNYDLKVSSLVYLDIGDCYHAKKDIPKAIEYYLKALSYYQQTEEGSTVASILRTLSNFHEESGDFKTALYYDQRSTHIRDSLSHETKTREVALLDVDRKVKLEAEKERQAGLAMVRKRNLQYMSITIAICLVFVGMLVLGMFPISRLTIKLLGYFFFISLFEFIVLLLDNNILHTITHGEPLKLWLIKIVLIGMLVPIQHFLEHGITKFLSSRQLLKARKKFSLKNLWTKKKTKSHKKNADTEELENDTAVL